MIKLMFRPSTVTLMTPSRNFSTVKNSHLFPLLNAGHFRSAQRLLPLVSLQANHYRRKHQIDKSRIPALDEDDLEEQFIKGSGPGGQHVNKRVNCCFLRHKPTGIIVKCHHARNLEDNRQLARRILIEKLDDHINGEMSIRAQKERILEKKSDRAKQKSSKLAEQKRKYQELLDSENQVPDEIVDSKPS